jgi:bifunctional DNase/RNase
MVLKSIFLVMKNLKDKPLTYILCNNIVRNPQYTVLRVIICNIEPHYVAEMHFMQRMYETEFV